MLAGRKMKKLMEPYDGLPLTRPPKGFAVDDPAMDLLLCRQWGVVAHLPAETATKTGLVKEIVERFKVAAPLVALLNAPLAPKPRKPMF